MGPSVGHAFLKYRGNRVLRTRKHQGTHIIAFLVEIQENSAKFKKIQPFIGRIVVGIELVKEMVKACSKAALLSSFSIFSARNEPSWENPCLLNTR